MKERPGAPMNAPGLSCGCRLLRVARDGWPAAAAHSEAARRSAPHRAAHAAAALRVHRLSPGGCGIREQDSARRRAAACAFRRHAGPRGHPCTLARFRPLVRTSQRTNERFLPAPPAASARDGLVFRPADARFRRFCACRPAVRGAGAGRRKSPPALQPSGTPVKSRQAKPRRLARGGGA